MRSGDETRQHSDIRAGRVLGTKLAVSIHVALVASICCPVWRDAGEMVAVL